MNAFGGRSALWWALLGLILGTLALNPATAAPPDNPGAVDPNFVQTTSGFNGSVKSVVTQPDGKMIVAGSFSTFNGAPAPCLARFNPDWTFDPTFHLQTSCFHDIWSLALQPDGKILAGGPFMSYDGVPAARVVRLNTDGTVDPSFAVPGTGPNTGVLTMAVAPDGKIAIGGKFSTFDGTPTPYLARLNPDGTLDAAFSTGGGTGLNEQVGDLAVQPDGEILVVGQFTKYDSTTANRVARIETDGTLDNAFTANGGTGLNQNALSVAVQSNGQIVVGGIFGAYGGHAARGILRLESDGTFDTAFTDAHPGLDASIVTLALQPGGTVFLGYFRDATGWRIGRLDADGNPDPGFSQAAGPFDDFPRALAPTPGGGFVVGGTFDAFDGQGAPNIATFTSSGTLIAAPNLGFDDSVDTVEVLPDQKLLVAGLFDRYGSTAAHKLARLNANGSLDPSFALAGSGFNYRVGALTATPSGEFYAGGYFTDFNGRPVSHLARLHADGTLDTSFTQSGSGLNGAVYRIAVQPDAKVLVAGEFTTYDQAPVPYLARFNSDGSLDTSFTSAGGTGANRVITAVLPLPDGKILIGGLFTSFNGEKRTRIAQLNPDGSLDTDFAPTGAGLNDSVYAMTRQANGKLLVGGSFRSHEGAVTPRLVRLESDGSLDPSFHQTGDGISGSVQSLVVDTDGRILVGGMFTAYDKAPAPYVLRLNADGSRDASFTQTGSGLSGPVYDMALSADGTLVAVGYFTGYNSGPYSRVIRLLTAAPNPPVTPTITPAPTPEPRPSASKKKQTLSPGLPRRIKRKGITVITPAGVRTNAGQRVSTLITGRPRKANAAGEVRYFVVLRGQRGRVAIRTFGYPHLLFRVAQRAPATHAYAAFDRRGVYVNGRRTS